MKKCIHIFGVSGSGTSTLGQTHNDHINFIEWAKIYDFADNTQRSYSMHNEWKDKLTCPLLILDGTKPINELLNEINLQI